MVGHAWIIDNVQQLMNSTSNKVGMGDTTTASDDEDQNIIVNNLIKL